MTVRMVLSGETLEADILLRRLRDIPGVSIRYLDEEWSEAVLYSAYAVDIDIPLLLREERARIEAEAEP